MFNESDVLALIDKCQLESSVDVIAVAEVDFDSKKVKSFQFDVKNKSTCSDKIYFDLASVTKILTNGAICLLKEPKEIEFIQLFLEHQSGLPAWGLLPKSNWKELILGFESKESSTNYSDLGAIRAQLEFENKYKVLLYDVASTFWDSEVFSWKDLNETHQTLVTGKRKNKDIRGEVHDPNAYVIGEKVSHAGLFSTVEGLGNTLINFNRNGSLIQKISESKKANPLKRFHWGWDTENSFMGKKASEGTFGHLGFTGTGVWIDPLRKKAL